MCVCVCVCLCLCLCVGVWVCVSLCVLVIVLVRLVVCVMPEHILLLSPPRPGREGRVRSAALRCVETRVTNLAAHAAMLVTVVCLRGGDHARDQADKKLLFLAASRVTVLLGSLNSRNEGFIRGRRF